MTMAIDLTLGRMASPLGDLLLVADAQGHLHACEYADLEARLYRLLDSRLGKGGYVLRLAPPPEPMVAAINLYFTGDLAAIDVLPVVFSGTGFQNRIWAALRTIPAGFPDTYGGLACKVGQPKSARAVGHANHNNPLQLIVPCHRVIGASGALTGYAGGLERKRWLLAHEQQHACATSVRQGRLL